MAGNSEKSSISLAHSLRRIVCRPDSGKNFKLMISSVSKDVGRLKTAGVNVNTTVLNGSWSSCNKLKIGATFYGRQSDGPQKAHTLIPRT